MNSKKWKIGILVACVFGLLTAGAGLTDSGMTWRGFLAVLCTALITNLGSYLMKHPVEDVSFDTELRTKEPTKLPLWLLTIGTLAIFATGCARFKSTVTEGVQNGVTNRTTVVVSSTFFDSKSELAKFNAGQTPKSGQKIGIGSMESESSGSNAVQVLKIVVEGAAKAALP